MRAATTTIGLSLALLVTAGCGQEEAVVDLQVLDASPAVPIYALQTFDPDITDRKRVHGPSRTGGKKTGGDCANCTNFETI